jgi:hypothetical protein
VSASAAGSKRFAVDHAAVEVHMRIQRAAEALHKAIAVCRFNCLRDNLLVHTDEMKAVHHGVEWGLVNAGFGVLHQIHNPHM